MGLTVVPSQPLILKLILYNVRSGFNLCFLELKMSLLILYQKEITDRGSDTAVPARVLSQTQGVIYFSNGPQWPVFSGSISREIHSRFSALGWFTLTASCNFLTNWSIPGHHKFPIVHGITDQGRFWAPLINKEIEHELIINITSQPQFQSVRTFTYYFAACSGIKQELLRVLLRTLQYTSVFFHLDVSDCFSVLYIREHFWGVL